MTAASGAPAAHDTSPYQIEERLPTIEEYRALCEAVGWQMPFEAAERGLPNSLYGLVARHEGDVVGMARLVGDDAIFFYVQDFAIRPEHQGRGLGHQMMDRLLAYIHGKSAHPFIALFSTDIAIPFYRRHGFAPHHDLFPLAWRG